MPRVNSSETNPSVIAAALAGAGTTKGLRVLTTTALAANTFAAGLLNYQGGYIDTLTATGNGALTVDGVAVAAGDDIGVFGEATGTHNGTYKVVQPGTGSTPYILRRVVTMDASADLLESRLFLVGNEGVSNGGVWSLSNIASPILNTTTLLVEKIGGGNGPDGGGGATTPAFYARGVITSLQAYGGTTTGVLTETTNGALAAQDGMTIAVGDVLWLPAGTTNISAASDSGPYVVTALGAAGSKWSMKRPAWWPTGGAFGTAIPMGKTVQMGPEGTTYFNSIWASWAAPGQVIDTNDPAMYPRSITQRVTLVTGSASVTISNIPIRAAAATGVVVDYISGAAKSTTVSYAPTTITPGALNTASLVISAMIAGMTAAGSGDVSVVNVTVTQ